MKLKFGIYFCDDEGEKFFGEGPYQLLRGIDELGSLRASAKRMGMPIPRRSASSSVRRMRLRFRSPSAKSAEEAAGEAC